MLVTEALSADLSFSCLHAGDRLGLSVEGIDLVHSVTVTVYQHLKCPQDLYGPGCEYRCNCPEREACHYIKGCHTGKLRVSLIAQKARLKRIHNSKCN